MMIDMTKCMYTWCNMKNYEILSVIIKICRFYDASRMHPHQSESTKIIVLLISMYEMVSVRNSCAGMKMANSTTPSGEYQIETGTGKQIKVSSRNHLIISMHFITKFNSVRNLYQECTWGLRFWKKQCCRPERSLRKIFLYIQHNDAQILEIQFHWRLACLHSI